MFGFNLPVASRTYVPFWARPGRKRKGLIAAHLLFIVGITTLHIVGGFQQSRVRGVLAEPSPLAGIYRVQYFLRDGVLDRANEDVDRWVRVGLNPPFTTTIQRASGETVRMLLALDAESGTVSFYDRGAQPPEEPMFTLVEVEAGMLRLEGEFEGKPTTVVMQRYEAPALLLERRFRWISEYPFNR
jgi:hypothetical protein